MPGGYEHRGEDAFYCLVVRAACGACRGREPAVIWFREIIAFDSDRGTQNAYTDEHIVGFHTGHSRHFLRLIAKGRSL